MTTVFDFVTVALFLAIAGAYFIWGAGDTRLLQQLLLSGIALAVANQLGNRGYEVIAAATAIAGAGYAFFVLRRKYTSTPD